MKKAPLKPKVLSKLCLRCNRVLPLGKFYPNRDWASQLYHDVWCKECVNQFCTDQKTLKQYCYENNRRWVDSYWDASLRKAQYNLANSAEYMKAGEGSQKRIDIENNLTVRQFFTLMNLATFYHYTEYVNGDNGEYTPMDDEDDIFFPENEEAKKPISYNKKWRGYFTQDQVDALEELYSQYEEDFVLDNVSIRDYARKVAKAS